MENVKAFFKGLLVVLAIALLRLAALALGAYFLFTAFLIAPEATITVVAILIGIAILCASATESSGRGLKQLITISLLNKGEVDIADPFN